MERLSVVEKKIIKSILKKPKYRYLYFAIGVALTGMAILNFAEFAYQLALGLKPTDREIMGAIFITMFLFLGGTLNLQHYYIANIVLFYEGKTVNSESESSM